MLYQDAFKTATKSLIHGKMRSILTMLGIVIGIASVIILMSIGKSAQDLIINQVESIGSNLIIIIPGGTGNSRFSSPAASQGIVITSLQQQDVDMLKREPSISAVVPDVRGQADVVYGDNDSTVTFQGNTANVFNVRNLTVEKGYPFTQADVDSFNPVAVIGPALADTLFGPNANPLNKIIRIKNLSVRVVGIMKKAGTGAFGIDQDNLVVLPITVAQKQLLGISYFSDLIVEANPIYDVSFVTSRVESILRQDHGLLTKRDQDDFTIRTQADILSILGNITSVLTLFLAAIASISLVVGGIGIMNVMLVSVTERTKEIGLRKAVGATNKDILEQFLIESVLLTIIGGVVGISIGAIFVTLIYFVLTHFLAMSWTFAFPLSAVFLSLFVSTLAGIVFGIYPARQAGKKNPIDTLRYE